MEGGKKTLISFFPTGSERTPEMGAASWVQVTMCSIFGCNEMSCLEESAQSGPPNTVSQDGRRGIGGKQAQGRCRRWNTRGSSWLWRIDIANVGWLGTGRRGGVGGWWWLATRRNGRHVSCCGYVLVKQSCLWYDALTFVKRSTWWSFAHILRGCERTESPTELSLLQHKRVTFRCFLPLDRLFPGFFRPRLSSSCSFLPLTCTIVGNSR